MLYLHTIPHNDKAFRPFPMRLKIELRCILFPLMILEMFLQLGVHLRKIQLMGHDLERHTCLYMVPQLTEPKPSDEVDGIWEGYQNNSAALKVPKNTVASIILK